MKANKFLFITGLAGSVIAATASTRTPEPPAYTNLKVLPKNISSRELQSIMADDFEDGLGVSCSFCHANAKDGHGLDFAADAKPEKEISRRMMRMTLDLNKRWLQNRHPKLGDAALVVQCNTCHKGQPFPDGTEPK